MKTKDVSKGWGKLLPIKESSKIKYKKDDDTEWMFKALGWKKK